MIQEGDYIYLADTDEVQKTVTQTTIVTVPAITLKNELDNLTQEIASKQARVDEINAIFGVTNININSIGLKQNG